MLIPGEWYAACALSFKFNACAYIILWVYIPGLITLAIRQSGLFVLGLGVGESECPWNFADICPLHTSFSKVIMTTRTWAVWNKNRFLTYALPIFYVVIWAGGFVLTGLFIEGLECQYTF